MKKELDRVFAYTLAKEIALDELDEISGGTAQMTTKQTVRATGFNAQGADGVYDVTVDW